jgi:hypothetical protein
MNMIIIMILWFLTVFFGAIGMSLLIGSFMGEDNIPKLYSTSIDNKMGATMIISLCLSLQMFILAIKLHGGSI